ncbi:hypothetical protein ONS95_005950 [Cadophora gregata]|uniref:uncharacterized protein n=1 Tax=Cadophora gregata TaxID=51156 RepID=UPI0026DD9CE9|nr:uncharacterized protein ONS95_005950 [Cadophora gregata]KAK0102327.1 hypothetical protein ONS95_005950 [Cadophora gregata]KAK0103952.1 hypothetical protein ONS96_005058 [Cadophora gregata f. sp. sojae]
MFEHFTFGAQAQTRYLDPEDISASPTDCSFPVTSPAPTSYFPLTGPKGPMNDIVDRFSQQTLIPDEAPHRSIWNDSLPSPDFSSDISIDDDFTPDEMTYVSTTRGTATLPSSSSSITSTSSLPNLPHPRSSTNTNTVACRRLQRQLNVQLQSCTTHIKDISTLVEDLLATNTQCRLHKAPSRPLLSSQSQAQTTQPPPPPSGLIPSSKVELDAELAIDSQTPVTTIDFADRAISPDEDEGFAEMDDPYGILAFEEEMSLRRASAPSGIRKYNVVRWRKSVECMGARDAYTYSNGTWNGGSTLPRTKVRSVPRMRRRKVDRVVG